MTVRGHKSSRNNSLSANPLYAFRSANYSAFTYSRKIINTTTAPSIPEDTWIQINRLTTKKSHQIAITPSKKTAPKNQQGTIYYTLHKTDAHVWSGNFHYKSSDYASPHTVILDQTLETLEDPRPILRWLRVVLKANHTSRAIVVSPLFDESSIDTTSRLSINDCYYREWSTDRLLLFLESAGFVIDSLATGATGERIITLCANEDSHRNLLRSAGLPSPRNSLILTTEHADTKSTGGIGSYIKEVEQTLSPQERPLVLVSLEKPFNEIMITEERADNIIDIRDIVSDAHPTLHTTDWDSASISFYKAVSELVFIYDQIHIIEFQEYQGIGARVAQAKRSEQLPMDVICVARAHGSQVYIDRASFGWSGMEKADVFELERLSVDLADEVSFPTQYLKDLYISTGYNIREDNSYVLRLPYSYPIVEKPTYRSVTKLIFLGKRSMMKGFPAFYSVVADITDKTGRLYNPNITEIQVIAAHGDASSFDKVLADLLKERNIKLTIGPMPRHEVLTTLQRESPHSIVCLPYGGDNHPVTILEMIANRCRFVAYRNGGIPELIPAGFRDTFTCIADPISMAENISELTKLSTEQTAKLINDLHISALADQKAINIAVRKSYTRVPVTRSTELKNSYDQLATVLVPIYNTDLNYVKTVIECLNRQLLTPKEVLFINDKSSSDTYVRDLHELIKRYTIVPYRVIDHKINLGLAGARNTALAKCTTKYLINVDSDDVISSDFIYDYVHFMENNPGYSAATCALESFTDEDDWNRKPLRSAYSYVGVGDCLVLGVSKNIFGHAGSCVVVEDARKIGGWDASDRSKWEDWAFFLKLTSRGMHIFNFPKVNYFYRVSTNSMVRTYANYPAELRIARNISGLSIWESHRLYAFINDEASHTAGKMHSIAEPDTLTYRVAKRVSQAINRVPIIKRVAKVTIESGWKIVKKARSK